MGIIYIYEYIYVSIYIYTRVYIYICAMADDSGSLIALGDAQQDLADPCKTSHIETKACSLSY